MASIVEILFRAKDQASAEIKKVTGSLNELQQDGGASSEELGLDFDSLVGAITTGAAIAATAISTFKIALEFSKEGAEIVRLQDTSAMLASSMGFDMDEIVAKVSAASLNTVSDMDIMSSAAKAMMLGVGSSAEELASLMETAAIRGRALGIDATDAFDQIVRGIGRLSPKILDNLGIIIDADATYAAYAESIGKAADELTEVEKRQALVNAVIADTAPLLAESGGLTEDAASKWEQMDAAQANFWNKIKSNAAELMVWWPGFWTAVYTAMTPPERMKADVVDVIDALNEAVRAGIIDETTYNAVLGDVNNALMSNGDALAFVAEKTAAVRDANVEASDSFSSQLEAIWATSESYEQFLFLVNAAGIELALIDEASWAAGKAELELAAGADAAAAGLDNLSGSAEGAAAAEQAVADATNNADMAMKSYSERLLFTIASQGLSEQAAYDLAVAMGLIDQNTVAATEQTNFYKQMLDAGIISQAQYNLLVRDLADDIENLPEGKTLEIDDNIDEVLEDLADLETWKTKPIPVKLNLDTSALDGWKPPTKTGTVNYQIGYIPNDPRLQAAGGMVQAAASGLAASLPYYWVGERGPEPFFPSVDGRIVSNTQAMSALRGGAGADAREIANAVKQGVKEAMRDTGGGKIYNLTMPTSSNPADVRTAFELMEAWA